jgi:hypothetical protein
MPSPSSFLSVRWSQWVDATLHLTKEEVDAEAGKEEADKESLHGGGSGQIVNSLETRGGVEKDC